MLYLFTETAQETMFVEESTDLQWEIVTDNDHIMINEDTDKAPNCKCLHYSSLFFTSVGKFFLNSTSNF